MQVLKEQDRANTDLSYVWVARGATMHPLVGPGDLGAELSRSSANSFHH